MCQPPHIIANEILSGVGKSSKPDGIKEVQLSTEIEVAAALVNKLKCKDEECKATKGKLDSKIDLTNAKFISVGHSFGRYGISPTPYWQLTNTILFVTKASSF